MAKSSVNKQKLFAKMNDAYQDSDLKMNVRRAFESTDPFVHEHGLELLNAPFRCCHMQNFIADETFLKSLSNELGDVICYEKNNDLYKFQQTDDLSKLSSPHIKAIRRLFCEEFKKWIAEVTGITFTNRVDISSSKYEYSDILLCHDDELDTRRVAFALYLTPSWTDNDGGKFELFDMDEKGQPRDVVKSFVPLFNSLSWFEVCEASHHQVSEVLSMGKTRLSVHGWLHSAPVKRSQRYVEPLPNLLPHVHIEEQMVYDWLNPVYLNSDVQEQIREKFESDSEIELQEFLKEEKYHELVECLKTSSFEWNHHGPPNKRNYEKLVESNIPTVVQNCIQFLRSEAIFLVLSNLTGLRLHRLASKSADSDDEPSTSVGDAGQSKGELVKTDESGASCPVAAKRRRMTCSMESVDNQSERMDDRRISETLYDGVDADGSTLRCRYEVRRWRHGSYTLVHDTDLGASEFALDAMLFCTCKGWQKDFGGYTSYIAKGEDEELLTVVPVENSLALVYRDKDTLKFVKHVNHRSTQSTESTEFLDFSFTYYE